VTGLSADRNAALRQIATALQEIAEALRADRGPCPAYTEALRGESLPCELRADHTGMHEHTSTAYARWSDDTATSYDVAPDW
jgi:hypothetical protein